jgi:hypothetical protein
MRLTDIPTKRTFVMSRILRVATAVTMIGFATIGVAQARAPNYHDYHPWASAGTLTFGSDSDDHQHVLQRLEPGAALGVRAYGCISHPDYGLYTPHFC